MMQTVVYKKLTGQIEMNSTASPEVVMVSFDSQLFDFIEFESDQQFDPLDNMYVHSGEITQRPEMGLSQSSGPIPADGSTIFSINGLPSETTVQVYGPIVDEWVEGSGKVEITVNVTGSYTILLKCFPYQDTEVKFDAT
jgi:hypothetical protein